MNYNAASDEELVVLAKNNDENATTELISRYKNYVKKIARHFFLVGGDSEDIIQEGMIGVFRAIESFNGKSSFKSYVYLCVRTGIFSLIKSFNSDKNKPLNNFISISYPLDVSAEIAATTSIDPEKDIIESEREKELIEKMKDKLSALEFKILTLYLGGYSYGEIGAKTNKNVKAIDNALQRIRKKIACLYGG